MAERTVGLQRANEKLRRLQSQMIRAHRLGAAEELAGSVAHAIHNPLTALIGTLQMAAEENDADPHSERALALARRINVVVDRTLHLLREGTLDPRPNRMAPASAWRLRAA